MTPILGTVMTQAQSWVPVQFLSWVPPPTLTLVIPACPPMPRPQHTHTLLKRSSCECQPGCENTCRPRDHSVYCGRGRRAEGPRLMFKASTSSFSQIKKKMKGGRRQGRRKKGNNETRRKVGEGFRMHPPCRYTLCKRTEKQSCRPSGLFV